MKEPEPCHCPPVLLWSQICIKQGGADSTQMWKHPRNLKAESFISNPNVLLDEAMSPQQNRKCVIVQILLNGVTHFPLIAADIFIVFANFLDVLWNFLKVTYFTLLIKLIWFPEVFKNVPVSSTQSRPTFLCIKRKIPPVLEPEQSASCGCERFDRSFWRGFKILPRFSLIWSAVDRVLQPSGA